MDRPALELLVNMAEVCLACLDIDSYNIIAARFRQVVHPCGRFDAWIVDLCVRMAAIDRAFYPKVFSPGISQLRIPEIRSKNIQRCSGK